MMRIDSTSNVAATSPKQQQADLNEELTSQAEVERVEQVVSEARFEQAVQDNKRDNQQPLPQNEGKSTPSVEEKTKEVLSQKPEENNANKAFQMKSQEKGQIIDMMV